jgi:hypothetical protein
MTILLRPQHESTLGRQGLDGLCGTRPAAREGKGPAPPNARSEGWEHGTVAQYVAEQFFRWV